MSTGPPAPTAGPPVDPRLLRSASAVRWHLLVATGCGVAVTALILAQAWLVSRVVAGATPSWDPDGGVPGPGAELRSNRCKKLRFAAEPFLHPSSERGPEARGWGIPELS